MCCGSSVYLWYYLLFVATTTMIRGCGFDVSLDDLAIELNCSFFCLLDSALWRVLLDAGGDDRWSSQLLATSFPIGLFVWGRGEVGSLIRRYVALSTVAWLCGLGLWL